MSPEHVTPYTGSLPQHVVIVGAGVIGAGTAYFLAKEGVKVTLVERRSPAYGGSGRNAGYISMITRSSGPQLDLAHLSRRLYAELASELSDFEFRAAGALVYYFEEQEILIDGFVAARRADGLELAMLDADRARELCPLLPDDIAGAVHSLSDACVEPRKLTEALVEGAVKHGANVVTGRVIGFEMDAGRCVGVRTDDGVVAGDAVLVAAGPWTPEVLATADLAFPVSYLRMQLAETAPVDVRFDVQTYGPSLFHEYVFVRELPGYDDDLVLHPLNRIMPEVGLLELIVQRDDGRLVLGCPIEFVESADAPGEPTVAGMAQTFGILGDHVPALQHIPVERIWGGVAPQTSDGLPVLSAVPGVEGLFIGSGHAYGNTVGAGSARVLADLIVGRAPEVDVTPFRYDRPAMQQGAARTVSL